MSGIEQVAKVISEVHNNEVSEMKADIYQALLSDLLVDLEEVVAEMSWHEDRVDVTRVLEHYRSKAAAVEQAGE